MATQNYQIQENCDKCQDNDPPVINLAVSFCKKCKESLCQQHSKIHHRNRVPAEHVLIDLSTAADLLASTPVTCATHAGEKIIAFCITCNQSLCGICLVKNHFGEKHEVKTTDEMEGKFHVILHDTINVLEQLLPKVVLQRDNLYDLQDKCDVNYQKSVVAIEQTDAQGKLLSIARYQQSLKEAQAMHNLKKKEELQPQVSATETREAEIRNLIDLSKAALTLKDVAELALHSSYVLRRCEEITVGWEIAPSNKGNFSFIPTIADQQSLGQLVDDDTEAKKAAEKLLAELAAAKLAAEQTAAQQLMAEEAAVIQMAAQKIAVEQAAAKQLAAEQAAVKMADELMAAKLLAERLTAELAAVKQSAQKEQAAAKIAIEQAVAKQFAAEQAVAKLTAELAAAKPLLQKFAAEQAAAKLAAASKAPTATALAAPVTTVPLPWNTQAKMFAADCLCFDSATGTLGRIGSDGYATALTTAVAGPQTTLEWVSRNNETLWGLVRQSAHLLQGDTSDEPGAYMLSSYGGSLWGPDYKGKHPQYGTRHPQWQDVGEIPVGTLITVHWARAAGTISFQINKGPLLLAFTGVPSDVDLYPAVMMGWDGATVRLH